VAELSDVTGSLSDVGQIALAIADQLSAQEGLTYTLCSFMLKRAGKDQPGRQSASAATTQMKKEGASANTAASKPATPSAAAKYGIGGFASPRSDLGHMFFFVRGNLDALGVWESSAIFSINHLLREDSIVCTVELAHIEGFDTKIGNQLSVEFAARELEEHTLLLIKGFFDPGGIGNAHFLGKLVVSFDETRQRIRTQPVGEMYCVQQPQGVLLNLARLSNVPTSYKRIYSIRDESSWTIRYD
jgi:hypothetical protein